MSRIRLTEKHPLDIKLRQVEDLMFELDVSIELIGSKLTFRDNQTGDEAYLVDVDGGEYCSGFPTGMEVKLIKQD